MHLCRALNAAQDLHAGIMFHVSHKTWWSLHSLICFALDDLLAAEQKQPEVEQLRDSASNSPIFQRSYNSQISHT